MPKIKSHDGKIHEITEIDFESPEEQWVEYDLSDGTKLKFRTSILSIVRSDQYDEHGQPYYFIKSQNQMRTYCPSELIKQDSEITISKEQEEESSSPEGYR